jgi:PD-(D/E)XK endonuclease
MNTKLKGDIAEQAVVLFALKKEWGVLIPVGDRLAYDLALDINNKLIRLQVKSSWFDSKSENYVVDVRRTKTNRRIMRRDYYSNNDFDFAVVYVTDDLFYVFPAEVFNSYGSEIHLVEASKRQRKPKSAAFRNAWELILQWAA